jgi:hypothetical protein
MAWWLGFRAAAPVPIDQLERALAAVTGGCTASPGEWDGNPRDGWCRGFCLRAPAPGEGLVVEVRFTQQAQDRELPPPPETHRLAVTFEAPSLRARLAGWDSLREALASLGYADTTLEGSPARIVDELEEAGERALASTLRARITAALVALVPAYRHVALSDTRPDDLDAVLRAYLRPEDIVSISFTRLGLRALPSELARFPNVRVLTLHEDALDASALRSWSFPRLDQLVLGCAALRAVEADDLRGAPGLASLNLIGSSVERVDPGLVDVCPSLRSLRISGTPLAKDGPALARLRASWPDVRIE